YRPGEVMRRLVQARDQTCRFPTCRRPATGCDLDHTRPYDEKGPTCPCNLAALCRRHHRLKQTDGWKLTQPSPGTLVRETPAKRTHTVRPDRYPL
ncbi:HNH endonuclease signature motif containing protein, partial [Thermopolyspora sp. NPDC052614]|uniref:HNH endonuclease signature motif containing protein n=1 Tax=Thermopolyspora sp. NPDC052614 TaxID=3155682 RepID=UPI0034157BB4